MPSRNPYIRPIIGIVIILAIVLGLYFYFSNNTPGQNGVAPTLSSFSVEKPSFVARGQALSKVEVWAIPTGAGLDENDYSKVGDMSLVSGNEQDQTWSLAIPEQAILATEIYARGLNAEGEEIGRISLAQKGATEIYTAIWGGDDAQSFTLKVGETANYKDFTLELVRITNDSRCPIDAVCVQQGDASVEVRLTSGGEATLQTLAVSQNPHGYRNYYIEITRVEPSPLAAKETAQSEYSVTFTISTDLKG